MELLTNLEDLPRWVEARGMLLSGRGRLIEPGAGDPATVVSSASVMLAVVFHWEDAGVLARAIAQVPREFSIVAPIEAESTLAEILPKRGREPATLFQMPPEKAKTLACPPEARLLRPDEYAQLENLPPVLRGELRDACTYSPIATAFAGDRPVSFCYSGWETERHWDVSIDTLEGFRRRGLGAAASTCLIRHFAAADKTAVWGSVDSNVESVALAQKLGFTPVDRLLVVYPDDAHDHH